MTEQAGKSNEEMASAFIVSTCHLLPKSSAIPSDYMNTELTTYSILCGSNAEFYIRPPITCIDDRDFMFGHTDKLVFSGEFLVLPSDVSGLADRIQCYKIETYDGYPGFVRLRVRGEMTYNWKYKKYEFNYTTRSNIYVVLDMDSVANVCNSDTQAGKRIRLPTILRGPAIKTRSEMNARNMGLESDFVASFWCPHWPKEARGWLKRPRNNGWPTIDTITEVVANGCHVVYVKHRSCRDEKKQWRFSFSLAEIILLQSWTPVQQIVYHLVRFIAKRELIQKDCSKEDEILCTYHLKTLMLWTCEEVQPEWWNSSSVIATCCELLKKLAEWLKKRHCPNYFIPEANLFHEPSSSTSTDKIERRLNEFCHSGLLCHWFIENYILPFIGRHLKLNSKVEVMPHFVEYLLPIFEFWKASELESLDLLLCSTFKHSHQSSRSRLKTGSRTGWRHSLKVGCYLRCFEMKEHQRLRDLSTIQNVLCFTYHDILLYILHAAYGLGCGEISWDGNLFVEFVTAISMQTKNVRSQYHNFPKDYIAQRNHVELLRAQDLMQNLTGSNSRSEYQLLCLISKRILVKALRTECSTSNGISSAAWVYLAAVHFATSDYETAKRLSLLVHHILNKVKETLNAGCLLFIDDVVRIVGLCVLYKKITDNDLHYINRRLYLDLNLSPEVFAHYLAVLSAERLNEHFDCSYDLPDSAFPMDEYLKALLKPKCVVSMKPGTHFNAARQIVYRRPDSVTETKASDVNPLVVKVTVREKTVIDVLMKYALENITLFYHVIRKDFGIQCNTADCYRALYLYKCCKYVQVLDLCERILHEPDLQSDLKEFSFANVLLLPPLDSFFDRDLQSLLGLHTFFYYLSPLNNDMGKVESNDESTFEHGFARHVYYYKYELSFLLQFNYSIKCHYFLGRHFLARYLKVRCNIDCNIPYSEAMTEFAAHKTNLPFERIIRRFLLRKFRI